MKSVRSLGGYHRRRTFDFGLSFVVLIVCETLLIFDIMSEYFGIGFEFYFDYHIELEALAIFSLGICLIFVGVGLLQILKENRRYRASVKLASGEFLRVLFEKFEEWNFSASESEVALLLIKGLSITEISQVRSTMAGTIKSQSNAIYRKAGVKGRHELVAYFVEDLLSGQDFVAEHEAA